MQYKHRSIHIKYRNSNKRNALTERRLPPGQRVALKWAEVTFTSPNPYSDFNPIFRKWGVSINKCFHGNSFSDFWVLCLAGVQVHPSS